MARKPKDPPGLALRIAAAERLAGVLDGAPFTPIGSHEIADGRDRAQANRLVTTALRRHGQLDVIVTELLERGFPAKSGKFEATLRLALAQLVFLPDMGAHSAIFLAVEAIKRDPKGQHLRGLLNAVLRRAQANSARYWDLPDELLIPAERRSLWEATYGREAVARFAAALLEGAPLDLTLRDDDPALAAALGAEPVMADTVRVVSRDSAVEDLPGYSEGRFWVQDAASAVPARLIGLSPGARVLDLCAAPGGKAAQLCKAGYAVTALDNDPARTGRLEDNLRRLGYDAGIVVADAETYRPEQGFDAVLLDAPCSATGTFRRHPEVLWRDARSGASRRVALQRRLIANAAKCLNPGGVLVYCVCSLEPEEGEEQAHWARSNVPGMRPDPIRPDETSGPAGAVTGEGNVRTHPGMSVPGQAGGTLDGFFVTRLRQA